MKKLLLTICIVLFLSGVLFSQSTQNVIIVVIDGARYSETFGDPTHQYIPNIWNQLGPLGTIYTSFYNDGVTQTNSGHSSILTGTWQILANDGSDRPHKPTMFEYYRKERNASVTDNFVVLGKDKLDILAYSDHPEYGIGYQASVKTSASQYSDSIAHENIKEIIAASQPRLIIVNYPETDRSAHLGPWSNYITNLRKADSLVNDLWTFLQADPVYRDKTTLIVTNDHGRHLDGISDGFRGHGDGCDGCRHISALIIGPDTPAGVTDTARQRQIDIAPTVGQLIGFTPVFSTGSVIRSALAIPVSFPYRAEEGWNLLSVPRQTAIKEKSLLFPTALSPAYTYRGGYAVRESLETGVGYWMKFASGHDLFMTGDDRYADTIAIEQGWNLIGTLSVPVTPDEISVSDPGITLSRFFGFNGSYQTADTLLPCRGYWVKASGSGHLFFEKSGIANRGAQR